MKIMYKPTTKDAPQEAVTNIGVFRVGVARAIGPKQEAEGKRLIDNGQFIEANEAAKAKRAAKAEPSAKK